MKSRLSTLALAVALMVAPASRVAGGFVAPVVVTGLDTGEPGIDVASDGTIYVNAPAGLLSNVPGSPSFVFRSDDGGATWVLTPPDLRANLPGGGDSSVAVDPVTGTLYMTDLWLGSATVSRSTDRGETWAANPLQGVVVQDRQWVATAGGGNVYHATHQIPAGLVVSKSTAPTDGLVYSQSTVAATPADQTCSVGPPGTLLPGTPDTGAEESQWFETYLESTDGGASFTALAIIDPVPVKSGPICTEGTGCDGDRELLDFQSVTLDRAGRANAAWTRSIDGASDTEIRFARQ